MKKILLAALLGGLANFVWGALSHMVLPIGKMGFSRLPREEAFLTAMRTEVPQSGLYAFPWMDVPAGTSKERQEAIENEWKDKYRRGPSGLLVVKARGSEILTPRQLGTEFVSNVLAALVAACIVAKVAAAGTGFVGRVFLCATLGLFTALSIEVSYWNWFGFPTDYMVGAFLDQTIGWAVGGIAIAAVLKNPARA